MDPWVRRLLLVEDEPLLASLMAQVLTDAGFAVRVCPDEVTGREAVATFDPDAALIDVHLGAGPSGLHLGFALSQTHPDVGILLLSRYTDLSAAGLDGWELPPGSMFLPKHELVDAPTLIAAIDRVVRGASWTADDAEEGPLAGLTRTQLGTLRLVALGLTNAAIAEHRGTSERNVEQRLHSVYEALGITLDGRINPRVEAVRRYISAAGLPTEAGLVPSTADGP